MLSSPIEEIKNRLDIVDVIGSYIKLQKAGANFRAVCPFHSEKKPSFFVSPARQIWHCFGCSKGGDIFGFIREIEGVEFGDALRLLAQKAGIELKKQPPELKTERNRLYEICELTCRFFEKQLEASSTGQEAKKYLLERGLKPESIAQWRLGYAPDVWQGLSDFLNSRGYQKGEIEKAGLGLTSEKGSFYDRFRGRIIFPVFDLNSQVVGFGGRVFKEKDKGEIAKYVNTPNTLLYDKSRILYGLNHAKMAIRKKDVCVLVEGYMDTIMSQQAGIENVVATSGTALTPFQLKILKRYSENLLTAFDMDVAGDSATKRGIELAQAQGFNIKVVLMTEKDPADIVLQNADNWQKMVEDSLSIMQFYFQTTLARFDVQTAEGKKAVAKILLPVIKRIPNKIEQDHWVQELSRKLGTKEEIIQEELKKIKMNLPDYGLADDFLSVPLPSKSRREILEERIASLVLQNPQNLVLLTEDCFACFSPQIKTILTDFREDKTSENSEFVNYLFLKAEAEEEGFDCVSEIQTCLKEIKHLDLRNKMDGISHDLKSAEAENDSKKVDNLTQEFKKLSNQLLIDG